MSGTPSKNTFDPQKQYVKIEAVTLPDPPGRRPLCDFELNELQDIAAYHREQAQLSIFGSGPVGDAFKPVTTGNQNEFALVPGKFWYKGKLLELFDLTTFSTLTTPTFDQEIIVYVDVENVQVDSTEDPDIKDTLFLGTETAVRRKRKITPQLSIGKPIPQPPTGVTRFRIATVFRQAGNPDITFAMIRDERELLSQTYVLDGGRAFQSGPLQITLEGLQIKVAAGQRPGWPSFGSPVNIGPQLITLPINSSIYYWYDATGTVQFGGTLPVQDFILPIFRATTDSSTITDIEDLRVFAGPYNQAVEQLKRASASDDFAQTWLTEHNADGTHKPLAALTGDFEFSDITDLRVDPTSPSSLSLWVNGGVFPLNFQTVEISDQLVGPFIPPGMPGFRVDYVMVDSESGAVQVHTGSTVAPTPTKDPYPQGKVVLAEIQLSNTTTQIIESLITDVRPWIGGSSSASSSLLTTSNVQFSYSTSLVTHSLPEYLVSNVVPITLGPFNDNYPMPLAGRVVVISASFELPPPARASFDAIEQHSLTGLIDGDTFTVSDGTTTKVFEFDSDGLVTPGNISVNLFSFATANDVATEMRAKIAAEFPAFTVSGVLDNVDLEASVGKITLSEALTNPITLSPRDQSGEKIVLYKASSDSTTRTPLNAELEIYSDSGYSAFVELQSDRFFQGDRIFARAEEIGIPALDSTSRNLKLTVLTSFDVNLASSDNPSLHEIQLAPAPPTNKLYTLTTGSYKVGDHSLQVYRNGKLLTRGDEYLERTSTLVELTFEPFEDDELLFRVSKNEPDGNNAPKVFEIQIATPGQSFFELSSGFFTPGSGELQVWRNGKRLVGPGPGASTVLDYTEPNAISIQLTGFTAQDQDVFVFRVN
jgi:hypothetical protein